MAAGLTTNIIDTPEVAVLTAIDIDHTQQLGNTVDKIAAEKCGIIKNNSIVAVYPNQKKEVVSIINHVCKEKNAKVFYAQKAKNIKQSIEGTLFEYGNEQYEISLLGAHQVLNASTAIQAVECLNADKITNMHIKRGLKNTYLSGRFELIHKNPYIIIDGAHNYAGSNALAEALENYFPDKDIIIVLGMLKDKEYKKCIARLAPLAKKLILTKPNNPKALEPSLVYDYAKQFCKEVQIQPDRFEAVKEALEDNLNICICGSFYLISQMPEYIEKCLSKN